MFCNSDLLYHIKFSKNDDEYYKTSKNFANAILQKSKLVQNCIVYE